MINSQSWREDYEGAEPREFRVGPWYVEVLTGGQWDLWKECESVEDAKAEVDIAEGHGYRWRVVDVNEVKVAV